MKTPRDLDNRIDETNSVLGKTPGLKHAPVGRVRRFFANLGPGLITGAADDDPSGISTYSVTGAAFGYMPLWTALFSFPLMAAVQLMCARLGLVTGRGLAIRPGRDLRAARRMVERVPCHFRRHSWHNDLALSVLLASVARSRGGACARENRSRTTRGRDRRGVADCSHGRSDWYVLFKP